MADEPAGPKDRPGVPDRGQLIRIALGAGIGGMSGGLAGLIIARNFFGFVIGLAIGSALGTSWSSGMLGSRKP